MYNLLLMIMFIFVHITWTTLTVQRSDKGMVAMMSRIEKRVNRWEQIPGPSSQPDMRERIEFILAYFTRLFTMSLFYTFAIKLTVTYMLPF